nr:uncharacterized protein LOC100980585 isoform X1 [Pan paniscus]
MWKPSPSSSPASWSCTALRAPQSCLRAATVRPVTLQARADSPTVPEPVHRPQDPWHIPGVPEPVHRPQDPWHIPGVPEPVHRPQDPWHIPGVPEPVHRPQDLWHIPVVPEPVHRPQDPWHIPSVPEPVHRPQDPWPWLQSVPPAELAYCLLMLLLAHCMKQQARPGHPDFLHREAWACLSAAGGLASPGLLLWATARPRVSGEAGPGRALVGADAACCPQHSVLSLVDIPSGQVLPQGQ